MPKGAFSSGVPARVGLASLMKLAGAGKPAKSGLGLT
jgi:hypothetical protein